MTSKPSVGTPARPGVVISTFIFALYNENQKGGPGTERHWGLLYPDGKEIYEMDLTGKWLDSDYKPLPKNNELYKEKIWCVVAKGVNELELGAEIRHSCGQGNGICDEIRPVGECYEPVSLISHANYAFNSYWVKFREHCGACFFNGLAVQTTEDPSHGSCIFPSVSLSE